MRHVLFLSTTVVSLALPVANAQELSTSVYDAVKVRWNVLARMFTRLNVSHVCMSDAAPVVLQAWVAFLEQGNAVLTLLDVCSVLLFLGTVVDRSACFRIPASTNFI